MSPHATSQRPKKGLRHDGVKELTSTNPRYVKLVNYRYYRLDDMRQVRTAKETGKVHSLGSKLESAMGSEKFTGKDPILVFTFLRSAVEEANQIGMSEAQLFLALPQLLGGKARDRFLATRDGARNSSKRLSTWPESVNYLLATYAKPSVISAALQDLREVMQGEGEEEGDYANRLNIAFSRCGGVHKDEERCTILVDNFLPVIAPSIRQRRQERPEDDFEELTQFAMTLGDVERGRDAGRQARRELREKRRAAKSSRRTLILEADARKSSTKSSTSSASTKGMTSGSVSAAGEAHVLGSGNSESEEDSESSSSSDEDEVLAMEPRFVPAPRVAFDTRDNRRRGWQNSGPPRRNGQLRPSSPREGSPIRRQGGGYRGGPPISVLRRPGPDDSQGNEEVICFSCYEKGHCSPDCKLSASDYATVVRNFMKLSFEDQQRLPRTSFDEALMRVKDAVDLVQAQTGSPSQSQKNE